MRRNLPAILASAFLATAASARGQPPGPAETGAAAPDGCWVIEGGSFARAGAAATKPVAEGLAKRWTWKPEAAGEIEGEPLAWGGLALVAVRGAGDTRRLVLIDLLDGAKCGEQVFKTKAPLAPSWWGSFVVVRAQPDRLEAWTVSGRKLARFDFFKPATGKRSLSGPVFTGNDVYVRADDEILRFAFGDAEKSVWRTKVEGARGELALRGDRLHVASGGPGGPRLSVFGVRDGRTLGDSATVAGEKPADGSRPVVLERHAFLFGLGGWQGRSAAVFARDAAAPHGLGSDAVRTFVAVEGSSAVEDGRGFLVAIVRPPGPGMLLRSVRGDVNPPPPRPFDLDPREVGRFEQPPTSILAGGDTNAEFVRAGAAVARAGEVVATGGGIFDARTSRILHRWDSAGRPVPVRGGWLTVRSGGEVALWREAGRKAAIGSPPTAEREAREARALLATGDLAVAPFWITAEGIELGASRRRKAGWSDVLALEEGPPGQEKTTVAISAAAVAEARAKGAEARAAAELARLAREAAEFSTREQVIGILDSAVEFGADESGEGDVASVRRRLRNWRPPAIDAARADAASRQAADLRLRPTQAIAEAAHTASQSDAVLARALLREVFAREPRHVRADEVLRSLMPGALAPPARDHAEYDAAQWLDFADALRAASAAVIPPHQAGGGDPSPAQMILGRARESQWGKRPGVKDTIFGLDIGDVVLAGRSVRPRNLGKCAVAAAEVTRALERLFRSDRPRRAETLPLDVRYFPTRDEFLKVTTADFAQQYRQLGTGLSPSDLKALESLVVKSIRRELSDVAGIYFIELMRAQFYEPEADNEIQPVEQVFRHELSHAWLDLRNPRRRTARTKDQELAFLTAPGQWCVEGFPTFLQEQGIDGATGDLIEDGASFTMDVIAHARTLLPWPAVVASARFRETSSGEGVTWETDLYLAAQKAGWTEFPNARLRTFVGAEVVLDPVQVFYRQAAAVCHWLYFADNGALRAKLVDFISDYYSGEPADALRFKTRFGIDPDDLGGRIVAYARKKLGR